MFRRVRQVTAPVGRQMFSRVHCLAALGAKFTGSDCILFKIRRYGYTEMDLQLHEIKPRCLTGHIVD